MTPTLKQQLQQWHGKNAEDLINERNRIIRIIHTMWFFLRCETSIQYLHAAQYYLHLHRHMDIRFVCLCCARNKRWPYTQEEICINLFAANDDCFIFICVKKNIAACTVFNFMIYLNLLLQTKPKYCNLECTKNDAYDNLTIWMMIIAKNTVHTHTMHDF